MYPYDSLKEMMMDEEDFEAALDYTPGKTVREAVDLLCSIQKWNYIATLTLHSDEKSLFTVHGAFLGAAKTKRDDDSVAWISFSSGTLALTGIDYVDEIEWSAEFTPASGGDTWQIHGTVERISAHGITL